MPEVSTFVTFAISQQPGNDAQIGSLVERKVTDSNGVATATLKVGSTPGMIVLDNKITFAESLVIVNVQGTAVATPQVTVIGASSSGGSGPSTSHITPTTGASSSAITPPNTGDAGLASSSSSYGGVWLAALALAVSTVAAGLAVRRRLPQR